MTDKMTLEEIEALAKDATPGPYTTSECSAGAEIMLLGGPSRKYVATVRIHQVPRHMGEWEEAKRTATAGFLASAPRLLEIAQEQAAEIARLKQYTCEACADADSCDRVGRAANRQCAAFRVVTKK